MIKISFGSSPIPVGCKEVSDERLKELISQSRPRKGVILLDKNKLEGECKMVFGEKKYFYKGQEVNPDAFLPTEFMDWRDG